MSSDPFSSYSLSHRHQPHPLHTSSTSLEMKLQTPSSSSDHHHHTQKSHSKIVALLIPILLFFTIIPLLGPLRHYPLKSYFHFNRTPLIQTPFSLQDQAELSVVKLAKNCDLFSGEWVRNNRAPYYTNKTCWAIHEYQNCMKYGRPDMDYMKWKWQPDECDLPVFNPAQFLEMVRDKSMAFVGDSVGRNHMQSLMCLLSRVEYPVDESYTDDEHFKRWRYITYNFTLATFWTPHLVKTEFLDSAVPTLPKIHHLYLDEHDENWTPHVENFSYVILNGGHWFFSPMVYHEEGRVVGCHYCQEPNVPDLRQYYGYRKALRTALKAISGLKNYKGITFLRTFAPAHFENGAWNEGGDCVRKRPYKSNETSLEGSNLEIYMTQIEEFKVAEKEAKSKGQKIRLMDVTQPMLLRPDGHPSKYGHWPNDTHVTLHNDCVHWCLPGPIDNWNDFLLEMLKMEGRRAYDEKYSRNRELVYRPNHDTHIVN